MGLSDSKEIEIWARRCAYCNKKMEFDNTFIDETGLWLLFARCKKCEKIFFLSIFHFEPKLGIDYILKSDKALEVATLVSHKDVVKKFKRGCDK